jgi:small subunit ribosomal protein S18
MAGRDDRASGGYAGDEEAEGAAAPEAPRRRGPGGWGGPGGFEGPGGRFRPRRSVCTFCVDKVKDIDYKDVGMLQRFLDDYGKIRAGRKTGTCARHQRRLAVAIKRARHLALLPFTSSGRYHHGD